MTPLGACSYCIMQSSPSTFENKAMNTTLVIHGYCVRMLVSILGFGGNIVGSHKLTSLMGSLLLVGLSRCLHSR